MRGNHYYENQRNPRNSRRSNTPSPVIIGLIIQLLSQLEKSPYKPPVTVVLLLGQIYIHAAPFPHLLQYDLSDVRQNCLLPAAVVNSLLSSGELQWNRIILSGLMHADDRHLYYNMLSLCWKGVNLEKAMGSSAFAKLVVYSLLCSHLLVIFITLLLHLSGVLSVDMTGFNSCAVGFSAVLFSLKVVWNQQPSAATSTGIMGFSIPTRYAAWCELLLVSLLTPNVSFVGHLAGIIAGVIYLRYLQQREFMR